MKKYGWLPARVSDVLKNKNGREQGLVSVQPSAISRQQRRLLKIGDPEQTLILWTR
jgi:hypothetical protein